MQTVADVRAGRFSRMKRNKPLVKTRAAGTQHRKRWKAGYHGWQDYERGVGDWDIVVAQSVVGDAKTFSMEDAVPAGEDGNPEHPYWKGVLRWRVEQGARTVFVYSAPPEGTEDTFVVFSARRKCTKGDACPLVRYHCTDMDFSLHTHHPWRCPGGVPSPGVWKRKGLYQKPGKGW
jgi:hypothetical protein